VEQLSEERDRWHAQNETIKKKAHRAVEQLKREKRALEERVAQLGAGPAPPPPEPPSPAPQPDAPTEHSSIAVSSLVPAEPIVHSGFAGFGNATADGGTTAFREAPEVSTVTYCSPDEIVELYSSCNISQAKLHKRMPQRCSAYVCVVEREGKKAIHLAWHLIESGDVVICLPERQPDGEGEYARMLQDSLHYFEIAGFMMDRFELSASPERQLQALEKIGICRMVTPP
jgi:hypothetical protein